MIITTTINTAMLTDARDAAVRQARAQGYRSVQVLNIRPAGARCYTVDLLVTP